MPVVFRTVAVLSAGLVLAQCQAPSPAQLAPQPVRAGLDVFLADVPSWAAGRRLGLITNYAGIDHAGRSNIDLLSARDDVKLVTLFAFEHGLRGDAPAGAVIADSVDEKTGAPIYSLYGEIRKPTPWTRP